MQCGRLAQCDAIACGGFHTVGLCADGTVLAVGKNNLSQCKVGDWRDVIAIACNNTHTVGLRADGTVVATGGNRDGDVGGWKLFDNLDTIERERAEMKKRAERAAEEARLRVEREAAEEQKRREERKAALVRERASLQAELAGLKGLFTGKRRKEIETRLAQIEAEQKELM